MQEQEFGANMKGLQDRILCRQDRQTMYNATLRGVRATIVAEEKQ